MSGIASNLNDYQILSKRFILAECYATTWQIFVAEIFLSFISSGIKKIAFKFSFDFQMLEISSTK